jgi:hypothetical protein
VTRTLSYSEISTALDCEARWDFRYGDRLAGTSLAEKAIAPLLSQGRAWGAAVATLHSTPGDDRGRAAVAALDESLDEDAEIQKEHGVFDQEEFDATRLRLLTILNHYMSSAEIVPMDEVLEKELYVPILARTGSGRPSSKYRMQCFLDATETDEYGNVWLDEFKLRTSLTPAKLITRQRQIRWYAWAWWQDTGQKVIGVYVNERLNETPKPPRVLKSGKLSHAKDQMCTPEAYEAACLEYDEEPVQTTVDSLAARKWHQRVPVMFRDGELERAGEELVSAAQLIHGLDTAQRTPLRNVKRANCNWCPFDEVCEDPDPRLVDALFERKPAKRDRPPLKGAAA